MPEFLHHLLFPGQFIPHGHCYLWQPKLVFLHIMSDVLITLAYYSIPVMLVYFVQKRRDLPFDWIFLMFSTFIIACGTTHAMEVWTLWHPSYWLSGYFKLVTAIASVCTALLLVPLIPKALALPSPAQLEAANQALQASEQRFVAFMNNSPAIAFIKDEAGRYIYVNQPLEHIYNTDLQGKTDFDWLPQTTAQQLRKDDLVVLAGDRTVEHLDNIPTPDGDSRHWLTLKFPILDGSGRKMLGGVAIDVTQRQITETALSRALQEQNAIMEAFSDVVYVLDANGKLLKWNKTLAIVTGLDSEVLQGRDALDFFPLAEQATIADAIQRVFETGKAQVEGHLIGAGAVLIPYEWSGVTLFDEVGNVIGITGIGRDVTERKRIEQTLQQLNTSLEQQVHERTALLQQALELEALLKRITDKVRDSLDENKILPTTVQELAVGLGLSGCNAALYNKADGTSTICYEYVTSIPTYQHRILQIADYAEIYNQLLAGQCFQFCSLKPNPNRGQVAMLACPIIDDQSVIGDLWLINQPDYAFNELEIRLVQQVANQCAIALRQARLYTAAKAQVEELEKLNALKDEFLSTVSHELRTPMSNMNMAIKMLKLAIGNTDERTGRYLEILQTECRRETTLINDLLELQTLEASSDLIELTDSLNLIEWLPSTVETFRWRAEQQQQTLVVNVVHNLPELISNRASLERVLIELINNACKYTPAGGEINLSVELSLCIATPPTIIFTISNSAEIPTLELPRVFEKFYRVPKTDPWLQGGTGLGLALVKKLVSRLGGTIFAESKSGWTTFTVSLPAQPRA